MTMAPPRAPRLRQLVSPLAVLDTRTAPAIAADVGGTGAGSGWARGPGSSTARGYGADWRRVRLQVLEAEPLCRQCAEHGRVTQATEVHHIEGFSSLSDPLRLALNNLAPICRSCHAAESAKAGNQTLR